MSSAAARKKGTTGTGNADGNNASRKADTMVGCKSRTSDATALCEGDAAADEPVVGLANFKKKKVAMRHELFGATEKGKRRKKGDDTECGGDVSSELLLCDLQNRFHVVSLDIRTPNLVTFENKGRRSGFLRE